MGEGRIPGTTRQSLYTALGWTPPQGWRAGIEARWFGNVQVNDANSDAAAGYSVLGAYAGYLLRQGPWEVNGYLRGDNLVDRR